MSDKKKKDKGKDKDKKNTVEFEGAVSMEQTGNALIELGERMLSGRFSVSNGKRRLEFTVGDSVQMNLRGRLSDEQQTLRIDLSWSEGNPAKGPTLIFGEVEDSDDAEPEADEVADDGHSNGADGAAARKASVKGTSRSSSSASKSKRSSGRNKRA